MSHRWMVSTARHSSGESPGQGHQTLGRLVPLDSTRYMSCLLGSVTSYTESLILVFPIFLRLC